MLKRTALYPAHRELGARMVEFGGWEMPVQYRGVIDEHLAVRHAAGLFDVSHMGEIEIKGRDAQAFLQELTINDVSRLSNGQAQYTAMCYPDGGVVDDLLLYRFDGENYLLCVNAANTDKDFAWVEAALEDSGFAAVTCRNSSADFAQLALQGPAAALILSQLTAIDLSRIAGYHFYEGLVAEVPTLISRTGYTGEDGFELYCHPEAVLTLWRNLLDVGREDGLMPAGLGARDTLRLEMKYPLYGHELSPEISPLEAGLGWITHLEKPSFIGREALVRQKEKGPERRLIGLRMTEAGVPRAGYPVYLNGEVVGTVTSGTLSPSLRQGIAIALVRNEVRRPGTALEVGIRQRRVAAEIVKSPFLEKS